MWIYNKLKYGKTTDRNIYKVLKKKLNKIEPKKYKIRQTILIYASKFLNIIKRLEL